MLLCEQLPFDSSGCVSVVSVVSVVYAVLLWLQVVSLGLQVVFLWLQVVFLWLQVVLLWLQVATQPLRDGTDLRDNVQITLAMFREQCGLAPIANIKQCVRMLVTRISASNENASLELIVKGQVSDVLQFGATSLSCYPQGNCR